MKRSRWAICANLLLRDALDGRRLRRGAIDTDSGTAHSNRDLADSLRYIEDNYHFYSAHLESEHWEGVVAEIGPGDNLGVEVLLLSHGATEVHAIDRYAPYRDESKHALIYEALARRYHCESLFRSGWTPQGIPGLHYHSGRAAEEFFTSEGIEFDAILSRAVLEHLYDPLGALDHMEAALKSGGRLIHQVDLGDHDMFPYHPPLTFLTIPRWIYRRMVVNGGRPNRVMLDRYRGWLAESQLQGEILVTMLVGSNDFIGPIPWEEIPLHRRNAALEHVHTVRPKLAREFREVADEDLAISSFALIATKA